MFNRQQKRINRSRKTHAKARISARPRLVVFKSNKAIYAQIVDDTTGKVVCGSSNLKGKNGVEGAKEVGANIAKLARGKKIEAVAFDRNGYRYHGQIKALADAAREGGLNF